MLQKKKESDVKIAEKMEKWFVNILKNPRTGDKLDDQEDHNMLIDRQSNQTFPIVYHVPVFIQEEASLAETKLHHESDTKFNYIDHYQKDADVFDYFSLPLSKSSRVEENLLHRHILSEIPRDAALVLDVGCGSAWLSREMIVRKKNIVSLDVSLTNTTKAQSQNPSPHHAAVVADVFNLPFGGNTFDCIVASEIMEHLYDPALFIQKLLHILKPDGKLIITTPYKEVLEYHLCIHCNKPTPKNAHLHTFDKKKMLELSQNPDVKSVNIKVFNNKLLIKLRLHLVISALSFHLWKWTDKVACKLRASAFRMMMVLTKK